MLYLKILKSICILAILILSFNTVYADDIVHIDSGEPVTEKVIDIQTTGDSLSTQLSIAKKLGIGLAALTLIYVFAGYRENSKYGLHALVHLKKADKKLMSEIVRSSKKIPADLNELETLALMYDIVDNKYLLLIGGISSLIKKGYLKIADRYDGKYFKIVERPEETKVTSKYELLLCDVMEDGCEIGRFTEFCVDNKVKIDEFIDSYAKENLKSLHKKGKFWRHWRIHGVDVYYPDFSTRQIIRDLNKLIKYFNNYGIENLESSTREESMGDYGQLIVFLDLELEAINSKALKDSIEICSLVRDAAEELNSHV